MPETQDIFLRAYAVVTYKKKEPPAKYAYLSEKQVGEHATVTILAAQHVRTPDFHGIVLTVKLKGRKYSFSLSFARKADLKEVCKQLHSEETDEWIGKCLTLVTKPGNKRSKFVTTIGIGKPGKPKAANPIARNKWVKHALVFDTESRIAADQSFTFGVYQLCTLIRDRYTVTEEGVFYANDLSAKERTVLKSYGKSAISDAKSFPPRFPLYSRSEFMEKVFWPAVRRGTSICGLNVPFDLSRLALGWDRGEDNEWTLSMQQYADGNDDKNYPHILIKPLGSKKAFIRFAKPWKPERWKGISKSYFLDLRTLAWALFNKSFSLRALCEELRTNHQKLDHEPTGMVTQAEIEYARQDVRCTVDALNGLMENFDQHPISLSPYSAYSPASVAKSYLEAMGIAHPAEKFKIPNKIHGISMQTYYGGRSETRIRCVEVPVAPLDFTSEYPTCCVLLGLFNVLTAESVNFEDDTEEVRRFLGRINLDRCFDPAMWERCQFFALVKPDKDILPVRTTYDGVTHNIGNNYFTSATPVWFAGPDLIASLIQVGKVPHKVPHIVRAIRMVPHGKQTGMRPVNLRGSMVTIDPYKDDLFRKIIEQRKLHKADKALYYWLKILANSIYGFFVELNPAILSKKVPVEVFSGEKKLPDSSDLIENPGKWFFPPLASLITAGGRLLLAMTEACVSEKRGTYLFCDTDSLAIVASKRGASLRIPGSEDRRILSWKDVRTIQDRFAALNPYDRKIVKGSILNLVDANYTDSDPDKPQRQLYGYSISAKRYALYEKTDGESVRIIDPKAHGIGFLYPPKHSSKSWKEDVPEWIFEMWDFIVRRSLKLRSKTPSWLNIPQMMRLSITTYSVLKMLDEWKDARPYNFLLLPMVDKTFGYAFDRTANQKVLLVAPFSTKQEKWFDVKCVNIHNGKEYKMVDATKVKNPPHNVVFPSQFSHLLLEYQDHPEAKSRAPDGTRCKADTKGLLKRAHVTAGEFRYVGKETDRRWGEGDDITALEFKSTEYGRSRKVVASNEVKNDILRIGINKCARLSRFDRKNFIRKLVRGLPVKPNSYDEFVRWLKTHKSKPQIALDM
jgi:hypothetical protein